MNVDKDFAKNWSMSSTVGRSDMELAVIDDLARAKAEYFARGGKITYCGVGESSEFKPKFVLPLKRTVAVQERAA